MKTRTALLVGGALLVFPAMILVFGPSGGGVRGLNLRPLAPLIHDLRFQVNATDVRRLAVLNLCVFIPAFVVLSHAGSRLRALAAVLAVGVLVELMQYIGARRIADIDDVILYVAGPFAVWLVMRVGATWSGGGSGD